MNKHRYSFKVEIEFELDANDAAEAVDLSLTMLNFIKSTTDIARGFRAIAWNVAQQPTRIYPPNIESIEDT